MESMRNSKNRALAMFVLCFVVFCVGIGRAGLIAYYDFGMSSPTSANMGTAGTAADGVLMNGATIVDIDPVTGDRSVEWALKLDATAGHQHMNIGHDWYNTAIPSGHPVTIAAWVKQETNTTSSWNTIMSQGYESTFYMGTGTPFGNGPDQIAYSYQNAIAASEPLNGAISVRNDPYWYHIVATIDAADYKTASLYINGVLQDSRQSWSPLYQNDLDLLIGDEPNRTAFDYGWNGYIDEVRIYDEHVDAQGAMDLFINTQDPARPVGDVERAANPSPANNAIDVSVDADLSWAAGFGASSHDVYFGTSSPGTFQGNQTATIFDPCVMPNNTSYYWRIDEINAGGTTTGEFWSFRTACLLDIRIEPVATLVDPCSTSEVLTELPQSIVEMPEPSDVFYIEIWASDVGVENTGVTSAYVDVSFCGEMSATSLEYGTLFFTFPSGTIQSGGVDEFGGSGLPSGIEPEWVRVGWVQMSADLKVSACTISLLESFLGVSALDRGLIPWCSVHLGSVTLHRDCNGNGIADINDIANGTSKDCNGNGIPDECDIASGDSNDCQGNGVPDECDIADGNSIDDNVDGIPDECQLDVRVVPVVTMINPDVTSEVRTTLPESAEAVVRGRTYYVEIWASDIGYTNSGLTGVYVDLSFCGQSSATSLEHGTIFVTSPSGTIQSGGVDEFGGSAVPDGGGIEPEWVRTGWIKMSADVDVETCSILLLPSATGVSTLHGGQLPWEFSDLNSVDFEIIAPARTYDLDGDAVIIGPGDWSYFVGSWQLPVPPADEEDDFDCDCFVGAGDLSWFATGWMKVPSDSTIVYPPCSDPNCAGASMLAMDNDMFRSGLTTSSMSITSYSMPDIALVLVILDAPSISDTTTVLPTSIDGITSGETYYVEVWVSDVGDIDTGVTSAYVDLSFPDETLSPVSISHGGIFTVLTDGSAGSGVIDELGGSTLSEAVGVEPQWARVAVVEMYATAAPISATFTLLPSSTNVGSWGRGVIAWSDIFLDSLSYPIADFDYDGDVDLWDFSLFASVWQSSFGSGNWNSIYDISKPNDYVVNYTDFSVFVTNWLVGVE